MKKRITGLIAIVLTMMLLLGACGFSLKTSDEGELNPKLADQTEGEKPDGAADNTAEEDDEVLTISLSDFTKYANDSASLWEFAQRFFTDVIVYKDSLGQYRYEPINRDLPQSDYDFTNLVNVKTQGKEYEYRVDGETVSIKGIDVSKYQGEIDWEKVAADGVKYAFIRLGYRGYSTGKMVMDESFEYNVTEALKNGVAVGVYFVTQAVSAEEGAEEAAFVLDAIAPYNITWPIVLDMEEAAGSNARTLGLSAEERTDATVAFCEAIKKAGHTPMLYSHIRWFIEELELERLTDYDKWFAQYFNRPFFPYEFQVWQYTNTGSVDGIKGNVDLNISFVDYAEKGEN